MLPRTRRISKTEFKELGRGKGYHSPFLTLFVYKKNNPTVTQFSFLCSKKVDKKAVVRNLLRRRGYHLVHGVITHVLNGYYCVFSFKKGAQNIPYEELSLEIIGLLKNAQIVTI